VNHHPVAHWDLDVRNCRIHFAGWLLTAVQPLIAWLTLERQ
jgi:hypothetical protein